MKVRRSIISIAVLPVILFISFSSCRKDPSVHYDYFVSKDLLVTYNTSYITNLLTIASAEYPEIVDLKPLIATDVNVFRLVCKTTINGEKVKVSGLVCVPVAAGDYPVLCFQNGTNTVNAYAPSNFVINPLYQMVEFVASMGYVVVIPDYPGFGESAGLVHPYLIKEPTVRSIVDMLYAVREIAGKEFPGIGLVNEYYMLGYSQGGWATLCLHKALELDYADDFKIKGSACGAGPYDLGLLFQTMIQQTAYHMPVYIAYMVHAYSSYNQFTNPVSEILQERFASNLSSLFNGLLTSEQINNQLTSSIPDLVNPNFLSGYTHAPEYSSVRTALHENSISPWNSKVPLFLVHGESDTQVNPITTEWMHTAMIEAGSSAALCIKETVPGVDHGDGIVPCMLKGLFFILSLSN
jgi:pimeloyl-ACP methyl ester carboxylesterase